MRKRCQGVKDGEKQGKIKCLSLTDDIAIITNNREKNKKLWSRYTKSQVKQDYKYHMKNTIYEYNIC